MAVISDHVVLISSWLCFGVVCQMFNLFGIVTNIINIICFAKQGFAESVNASLLGLAVSDLGSLVTMLWTCICVTPAMQTADMPFDPKETCYLTSGMLHLAFTRVSGCITAMITLERCLCITAPLKVRHLVTTKRTTVITVCVFVIFFWSGSPVYAVNSLGYKFSVLRNKTLYGLKSTQDKEIVETITFSINNFIIPFGSFIIIVVCTTILSVKLQSATKWRQNAVTSPQEDRLSSRNKKIAKMVVMVSCLFIVCFVPVSVTLFAIALLPSLNYEGEYNNITMIIAGIGYVLESVNSSMNIVIYYQMNSKYRAKLFLMLGK